MGKHRVALILSLFALGVAGCGGGGNDEQATTVPTIPLTVPGADTTSSAESNTDTTVDTTPDTSATPAPAPTPTPAPAAPTSPAQPQDSPQNDTAPPPGSEAQKFENFCTQNPGAC